MGAVVGRHLVKLAGDVGSGASYGRDQREQAVGPHGGALAGSSSTVGGSGVGAGTGPDSRRSPHPVVPARTAAAPTTSARRRLRPPGS